MYDLFDDISAQQQRTDLATGRVRCSAPPLEFAAYHNNSGILLQIVAVRAFITLAYMSTAHIRPPRCFHDPLAGDAHQYDLQFSCLRW